MKRPPPQVGSIVQFGPSPPSARLKLSRTNDVGLGGGVRMSVTPTILFGRFNAEKMMFWTYVPGTKPSVCGLTVVEVPLAPPGGATLNHGELCVSLHGLSLIHISEPTRLLSISYAVFCLKKKKEV